MKLSYKIPQGNIDMKYTDFMIKEVDIDTNEVIFREYIPVKQFSCMENAWIYANKRFSDMKARVLNIESCHNFKWINDDCFMYDTEDKVTKKYSRILCYVMGFI